MPMSNGRESPFRRHPANPVVVPGEEPWRRAASFNPGVVQVDGRFHLFERAAGCLRPFRCAIGKLHSDDGVHFELSQSEPVLTPAMCGSEHGSVQDPRLCRIDDTWYMSFAFRPYAWHSHPTGVGVPESFQPEIAGWDGDPRTNQTRSGLAVSSDLETWRFHSWITPAEIDDRDVILFPERIGGRYWVLRRPLGFVDASHKTPMRGCIHLSHSADLVDWSEPELVVEPEFPWESNRIGGSTPPIPTDEGWLVLYHGVETLDPAVKRVVYRLGLLLLDRDDPRKVIARPRDFIMEPEAYYERFGTYIPNVIFPSAGVVVDGVVHLYYGCCDTSIGLATASLRDLIDIALGR